MSLLKDLFNKKPEKRLTKRERERRKFLKMMFGGGVATVGLVGGIIKFTSAWENGEFNKVNTDVTANISGDIQEYYGEEGIVEIMRGFDDYVRKYGSPIPSIDFRIVDLSDEVTYNPDGSFTSVLEQAAPGIIELGQHLDAEDLYNITIHAMTHACQPLEPTPFATPMLLADGSTAMSAEGLSLNVIQANGTETGFRAIEEGACEALAVYLDPNYVTSDPSYHSLGTLTLDIVNTFSSPAELSEFVQNNDLMGFVGMVVGKEQATQQDLEATMTWYQRARNGEDVGLIGSDILTYRDGSSQIPDFNGYQHGLITANSGGPKIRYA